MQKPENHLFLGLISLLFLAGCGGYSSPSAMPGPQAAMMSLSATDAPPAGVTVFSFEVTLTGATLTGTGIYANTIDLLVGKGAQRIEVKHLETENAFLNLTNVTPGNYTTLKLTFSNPELTFRNDTAAAIAGCAPAAICEIKPAGNLTSTINGQFNPVMGAQTGVLLDFNLNTLLTQTLGVDFSTAGAISATQQAISNQGDLEQLDDLEGIVSATGNSQFTLQTSGNGNVTVTITSFTLDTNGLSVPTALQQGFENSHDTSQLIPGQTVQVRKVTLAGGPAPAAITVTTDRVRLRDTRLTATVSGAPAGNNFNIGALPGLFTANGINAIQVQTSSNTNFENVAGANGLADNNTVSVRGLLFTSTPNPVIVADKVRKR